MAIPIKYNGLYRFRNVKFPGTGAGRVLNAYGTGTLANGRNVMLYTKDTGDTAQQWRAMYAGVDGDNDARTLYWLNCEMGGRKYPYALDRYTASPKNNADVYRSVDSSAADQLVFFTENGSTGQVRIRLYDGGYALTAASDADGGNNPSSLTAAGNCYWAPYNSSDTAQLWTVETVSAGAAPTTTDRATNFPSFSYYTAANNGSYPMYVGECTWYCRGRFHEIFGIANVGTGHAYQWATCSLPSGVSRDTSSKTLRKNSVAVFGANSTYAYGHVVFIESISGENVTYSDANGTTAGSTFSISNGQIEVRSSQLPSARDGYKITTNATAFRSLFGSGLAAVIYKT